MGNGFSQIRSTIDHLLMVALYGRRKKQLVGNLYEYRQAIFTWQLVPGILGRSCGPRIQMRPGIQYCGRILVEDNVLTISEGDDPDYFVVTVPAYSKAVTSAICFHFAGRGDARLIRSGDWAFLVINKKDSSVLWVLSDDTYQYETAWGLECTWTDAGFTACPVPENRCWTYVNRRLPGDWRMLSIATDAQTGSRA